MTRERPLLAALALLASCAAEPDALDHPEEETLTGEGIASSFIRAGDGWLVSPPRDVASGATRVAAMVTLSGAAMAADGAIEVRGVDAGGAVGPWVRVEAAFREGELAVVRANVAAGAARVQLRLPEGAEKEIALLTWSTSTPDDVEPSDADDGVGSLSQGLAGDLAARGILPRSAWGARAPRCGSRDRAKVRMAIHHTVTGRSGPGGFEPVLRQIQAFHMDGRGYCDVGYHFYVTADGRVWEARDLDTLGAHSGNYNSGNIGIVFVGCFDGSASCNGLGGRDVPDAMIAGAARAVATLAARHGIPIDGDRIKGHGEQPYQQTSCPGSSLRARLEELRSRARGGGGPAPAPAPPARPAPPPPATPAAPTRRACGGVGSNELLERGAEMRSCNGAYRLVHQGDGNVVLYRVETGRAVWSTGTSGKSTSIFAMQWDGNLVLYAEGGGPAIWSSGTAGQYGASLAVQDDGNVVIYESGRAVWATGTVNAGAPPPPPPPRPSGCGALHAGQALGPGQAVASCNGQYTFVHQTDGNVVLYHGGRALWSSRTDRRSSDALVMQGDGNLVLYAPGAKAIWASNTAGRGGAWLAVQDDGNAVLYQGTRAVWATATAGR